MNLKDYFFAYRSFTPIPIVFILLYFTEPIFPFLWVGFGSVFIGEYIRFYAVRYAGGITRSRKVGAPSLCTSGPYAHIRNPLYLGNMVIYMGVTFIAGGVFMWGFLGMVFIYFTIQYVMIISLEEETLSDLFGAEYDQYKINVPRFIPRITPWKSPANRIPASITKTMTTEKRTLQNILLLLSLIFIRTYFGNGISL